MSVKRARKVPMGIREPEGGRYRSQQYRAWVRGCVCAIEGRNGHVCVPTRAAAHVRTGTDGCKDVKPSDFWCLSLCDDYCGGGAHGEQHRIGEPAFERKYSLDMKAEAKRLWNDRGHGHKRKYELEHGQ